MKVSALRLVLLLALTLLTLAPLPLAGCGSARLDNLGPVPPGAATEASALYYVSRLSSTSDSLTFILFSASGPQGTCPDFDRSSIPLLPSGDGNYNVVLYRPFTVGRPLALTPGEDGFLAQDATEVVCGLSTSGTPLGYSRPTGTLVVDTADARLVGRLDVTRAGTTESFALEAYQCPAPELLAHGSMCPE
ncbi:MAG: hypothetical protein IT384_09335 [Deltaproteobacteria bacterium]|nr:hypothetical protein [Deltaproteobacteria bacterium]